MSGIAEITPDPPQTASVSNLAHGEIRGEIQPATNPLQRGLGESQHPASEWLTSVQS